MISPRYGFVLLFSVIALGGLLRFAAVGYGLPRHDLGQDEMITATRVRDGVLVGHEGWPRFHWPNLNVHLSRAAVGTVRWVEDRAGAEPLDDVLIGRVYTALLGTLTLVALYLVGARLFDPLVGVVAAAFLAVIPLHAFRSRLWVPDVPMTLFYTLALLAAVGILARPTYARFVLAAAAIGLATAMKYNGVGACLPVVVAAALAPQAIQGRRRLVAILARLALAAALAVAVFFAADLYALRFFDEVLKGIGFIGSSYIDAPASGFLGWHIWTYVARSMYAGGHEGVGQLISLLALAGWALLMVRRRRAELLAWLPGLLFLLIFSSILHDPYERMFLPLVPHIALLAAVALVGAARWAGSMVGRRFAAVGGGGFVLVVLAVAAIPAVGQAIAARHARVGHGVARKPPLRVHPQAARSLGRCLDASAGLAAHGLRRHHEHQLRACTVAAVPAHLRRAGLLLRRAVEWSVVRAGREIRARPVHVWPRGSNLSNAGPARARPGPGPVGARSSASGPLGQRPPAASGKGSRGRFSLPGGT